MSPTAFAGLLAAAIAVCAASASVRAETYPGKPIRLVVGFPPGGAADFVARAVSDPLSRTLGQPVVIENRPGAGSSIAAEVVARAAPDGYTILIASPSSVIVNPVLNPGGYNPRSDLVPISKISTSPLVVAVHPGLGVNSIRELIAAAKKAPGRLNVASAGNGSAPHLAAVLFLRLAGVDLLHVPFKGGAQAVQSVLAGDTQVTFATPPSVLPQIQAGRLRGLAITSPDRSPLFPNLPGMTEAGLADYAISLWYGLFAPAGTAQDIVQKLFVATQVTLKRIEVKETLAREGTETSGSRSPADFAAFVAEETVLWTRLVQESGAKID